MSSLSPLFQPTQVGNLFLTHRIVLAPMTRLRIHPSPLNTPIVDLVSEYYRQRAKVLGSLLISESTLIAPQAGGSKFWPGIWSKEQIRGWKQVTDAVHEEGSFIFCQLTAIGRAAKKIELDVYNPAFEVLSSSDVPYKDGEIPRAMRIDEIQEFVCLFAQAARNAIEAGLDGVEVQGGQGDLVDQFHQDVCNNRMDEYGGDIESRARFVIEALGAVTRVIGQERVGIRFSPWTTYQGMRMEDPIPQFSYTISKIKELFPRLAYLHIVESRLWSQDPDGQEESNQFIRDLWSPKTLIAAGGYTVHSAEKMVSENGDLIAFGRNFTSNPDLPDRFRDGLDLTPFDRSTFYAAGQARGYVDFPIATRTAMK